MKKSMKHWTGNSALYYVPVIAWRDWGQEGSVLGLQPHNGYKMDNLLREDFVVAQYQMLGMAVKLKNVQAWHEKEFKRDYKCKMLDWI